MQKTAALRQDVAPAPVDLVIFDCDGVLVDSEPLALGVLLEAIGNLGIEIDREQAHDMFLGRSMASISQQLNREYGIAFGPEALEMVRQRLVAVFREKLQPVPFIETALDALTMPMCVASSSQPERIALSLTLVGLHERLHPHIFSATMVARGKPAPDLFLFAAEKMGVAPERCLVVEDSPAGIEAGLAAQMRVLAYTGGGHAGGDAHRQRIARSGAMAVFDDMRDLGDLVEAASGRTLEAE